jgi:dTDP-4-amino-4,6-dideoxygalactose transaminase
MASMLIDIQPGDEVIVPSYTFVSTALAFVRQGAKIVFADSRTDHPGIDEDKIEELITEKTKAIVPVHYAGVACDMDKIMALANKYNLFVVEDAAQAIDSYYKGKALGSIGHLGAFSFHETKNIQAGEGGLLVVNDEGFSKRAEIIREKGTNRSAFFRGEVNKYGWVDIGSSFLPTDMVAAFLKAQLEQMEGIQKKRRLIWERYREGLAHLEESGQLKIPVVPEFATNNGHMFYVLCNSLEERSDLINHLKNDGAKAVFHYLSLHKSAYYSEKHDGREIPMSDYYDNCLLRLPFYYELKEQEQKHIIDSISVFYANK